MTIELRSRSLTAVFADIGYGLQLVRATWGANAIDFAPAPMFTIVVTNPDPNRSSAAVISSGDGGSLPWLITEKSETRLVVRYPMRVPRSASPIVGLAADTPATDPSKAIIQMEVELDGNELRFGGHVEMAVPTMTVSIVAFPSLIAMPSAAPDDDFIALPWQGGMLVRAPHKNLGVPYPGTGSPDELAYPSHKCSIQIVALYNARSGARVTFHARDGERRQKQFMVRSAAGHAGTEISLQNWPDGRTIAQNRGRTLIAYRMPYPYAVSFGTGDWYDAAQEYRSWTLSQPDFRGAQPLRDRGPRDLSRNFDALVYRGANNKFFDFDLYVRDQTELAEALDSRRIQALWFFWHQNDFDDAWPSHEPKTTAHAALRRLAALGFGAMLYTLPRGWWRSWSGFLAEGAGRFGTRSLGHGPLQLARDPDNGVRVADIQLGRPDARATIVNLWTDIMRLPGVTGVYFDVVAGAILGLDQAADLPETGSSAYSVIGRQRFFDEFRSRGSAVASQPAPNDFAVISEFQDESSVPTVDGCLEPVVFTYFDAYPWVGATPAPIFATVYHEYLLSGDLTSLELSTEEDALQAIAFILHRGRRVLMFSASTTETILDSARRRGEFGPLDLLRSATGLRDLLDPFLVGGRPLRPVPGFPHAQVLAGHGLGDASVFCSAWADQDRRALVVSNSAATERRAVIFAPKSLLELPATAESELFIVDPAGAGRIVGSVADAVSATVVIPPRTFLVLLIVDRPPRTVFPFEARLICSRPRFGIDVPTPTGPGVISGPKWSLRVSIESLNAGELDCTVQVSESLKLWTDIGLFSPDAVGDYLFAGPATPFRFVRVVLSLPLGSSLDQICVARIDGYGVDRYDGDA